MKRVIPLLMVLILTINILSGCRKKTEESTSKSTQTYKSENKSKTTNKTEIEQAIQASKKLYKQKKEEGIDFSNGPCLSNQIIPNWVLDIAHDPRQKIDNDSKNQCPAYIQKKALHFVELDPKGNLIRAI